MKLDKYYLGTECEGVIFTAESPDELYCSFIEENEYIKLNESDEKDYTEVPSKDEVKKLQRFMIRVGDENVLCEVLNDLKADEVQCQVLLCNTSVKLKVNYKSLRHLNENINSEDIIALKIFDFAPLFPNSWSSELTVRLKEKVLFKRFIIQFKSNRPDPADGKYPVNLFELNNSKSVTEEFIEEKLAVHYSTYYEAWLNYETNRVFHCKEKDNKKYIISTPMFKNSPFHRETELSKPKFNVEAQPFTPNSLSFTSPVSLEEHASFHFNNGTHIPLPTGLDNIETISNGTMVSVNNNRIKQGLEVVSPGSKRRVTNSNISQLSPNSKPFIYCPNVNNLFNVPEGFNIQSSSLGLIRPQSSDDGCDEKAEHPLVIQQGPSNYSNVQPFPPQTILSSAAPASPKKFGNFSYPMPFAPPHFPFQPYALHNMYMFQSAMLKPQIRAEKTPANVAPCITRDKIV